jgi:hypothetical protein
VPHGDGLVGTVDCCNHNGHSDGIVPIGRIQQNSSHIVGPDCNWCPWDRTRHNESHPEKWNGIGVSIRGSVHAKVVEVEWVFSSGIVA